MLCVMRVPVLHNVRRADLGTVVWIPALPPKISDRGTGQSMAALLRGPAAAVGITVTGYETPPDPGMTRLPRPPAAAEQPTLCDRVLHDRWPGVDLSSLERSQRVCVCACPLMTPPPLLNPCSSVPSQAAVRGMEGTRPTPASDDIEHYVHVPLVVAAPAAQ